MTTLSLFRYGNGIVPGTTAMTTRIRNQQTINFYSRASDHADCLILLSEKISDKKFFGPSRENQLLMGDREIRVYRCLILLISKISLTGFSILIEPFPFFILSFGIWNVNVLERFAKFYYFFQKF